MVHNAMNKRKGISLLEFLAVIAILVILFSVIAPAVFRVRDNSRTVLCLSNIKQLSLAVLQYSLDNERLPTSLYEVDVLAYYNNNYDVAMCPEEDRDINAFTVPRGSYGLHRYASNYNAAAQDIPLVADSYTEDLTVSSFRARHKNEKKGNVAYLDGHVEQITDGEFSLTP